MSDASQGDRPKKFSELRDYPGMNGFPITIHMEGGVKAVVTETDTVVTLPEDDADPLSRAIRRGQKLIELGSDEGEDAETRLSDVLADLMHWADHHHVYFDDAVASAERAREQELDEWPVVQVRIVNTYSDGHESDVEVMLPSPTDPADLDEWWQDVVFEHTGDGHGEGTDLGSVYEATIIHADDETLVGQSNEWID